MLAQAAMLVLDETQTSPKCFFPEKKNCLVSSLKACSAGLYGQLLFFSFFKTNSLNT